MSPNFWPYGLRQGQKVLKRKLLTPNTETICHSMCTSTLESCRTREARAINYISEIEILDEDQLKCILRPVFFFRENNS